MTAPDPPPAALRDVLMIVLHTAGAWCGDCDYDEVGCSGCREVLGGYADAILADPRIAVMQPASCAVEYGLEQVVGRDGSREATAKPEDIARSQCEYLKDKVWKDGPPVAPVVVTRNVYRTAWAPEVAGSLSDTRHDINNINRGEPS